MADQKQCQLIHDTVSGVVNNMLCGSAPTQLFQSELATPPDGTFFALIGPSLCTITFTFHQCGGSMETRSFAPGVVGEGRGLAIALTVPNVESITATCSGGELGSNCSIDWFLLPHYCRCCKG